MRDDTTGESSSLVDRRTFLRTTGAAGAVGALGGVSAGSAAAKTGDAAEKPRQTDWESAADDRIQKHRTADLTVEVTDADGNPVEGADVEVAMQEHEFGFGTALNADHLINQTSEGDTYREEIKRLFNTVVMGNHHKWRFWESNERLSDLATQWALDQGMDIRGHVCLWSNISAWAVPPDVVKAMGVRWEANGVTNPELDPDYVRQRTLDHVRAIIEDYGDVIEEWEVYNEPTHRPEFVRAINGVPADQPMDGDPLTADVVAEWYNTAREAAPEGTTIAVNDYNTLSGPYPGTRADYERHIEFIKENASLDSIGLQCHFNQGSALDPQQIKAGLDQYAQHDLTLQITEFDMADPNWPEEDKATFFRRMLKIAFSHPAVDEFLVWGIYSPLHWREDAPFYAEGWERKPPLDVYEKLVLNEWWTEETGTTDSQGAYSATGFKGEYEITASDGDVTRTVRATLSDGGTTVTVALDPDATPEPTPTPREIQIDDTTVTTPEGGVQGPTDTPTATATPTETKSTDTATATATPTATSSDDTPTGGDTSTDTGMEDSTPTTGGTSTEPPSTPTATEEASESQPTDTATSSGGQPGLGVLSGLAGLAGLGGYLLSRDGDGDGD